MSTRAYDVVIVGGGTAGAFAAATAAAEGVNTVIIERKSADEAGHIACGDAIKGTSTFPDVIDLDHLKDEAFTNQRIQRAVFENPEGDDVDIDFGDYGAVIDRKRYGEVILSEAQRLGAEIHYDTVVQDVQQTDDGTVTGVKAMRDGTPLTYEAEVTVDAAGALSILQDKTEFEYSHFDTNVSYSQFCSAYREVLNVPEPVSYDDAIVFKPTKELGYLWYFPRTSTEINVGLGFQMTEEPIELVETLKRDIQTRPELRNGTVKDKLGASLPTRRPYDSAVADGFVAVGDAAGHVNPTTGGGIPGAAKSAHWAAKHIVRAISEGDVSEHNLWQYNEDVMTSFGKRFAAIDLYNLWGTSRDVDELVDIVSAVPGQQLADALSSGSSNMGLLLKLKTLLGTFGHWDALYELYQVSQRAKEITRLYAEYPSTPEAFETWQADRDDLMDEFYTLTGAVKKY